MARRVAGEGEGGAKRDGCVCVCVPEEGRQTFPSDESSGLSTGDQLARSQTLGPLHLYAEDQSGRLQPIEHGYQPRRTSRMKHDC